jgi:hypothetical protein
VLEGRRGGMVLEGPCSMRPPLPPLVAVCAWMCARAAGTRGAHHAGVRC